MRSLRNFKRGSEMKLAMVLGTALIAGMTQCSTDPSSSLPDYESPSGKERLADTSVEIDGETYVVRQNRVFYPSGRSSLGWAIETDGRVISCGDATPESCRGALARANADSNEDSGMGY